MTDTDAMKKMSNEILRQQQLLTDYSRRFDEVLEQVDQRLEDSSTYSLGGLAVSTVSLSLYLTFLLLLLMFCRRKVKKKIKECCSCQGTESDREDIEESIFSVKPEVKTAQSTVVLQDETAASKNGFISQQGGDTESQDDTQSLLKISVKKEPVKNEPVGQKTVKKEKVGKKKVRKERIGTGRKRRKPRERVRSQSTVATDNLRSRIRFDDSQGRIDASDHSLSTDDESSSSGDNEPVQDSRPDSGNRSSPTVGSKERSNGHWVSGDETVIRVDREDSFNDISFEEDQSQRKKGSPLVQPGKEKHSSRQQLTKRRVPSPLRRASESHHVEAGADPRRLEFSSNSEADEDHQFVPKYVSTQRNSRERPATATMQTVSSIGSVPEGRSFPTLATVGSRAASLSSQGYQPAVPQPLGNRTASATVQSAADIDSVRAQPTVGQSPAETREQPATVAQDPAPERGATSSPIDPGRPGGSEQGGGESAREVGRHEQDSFHLCSSGGHDDVGSAAQSVAINNRVRIHYQLNFHFSF